MNDADSVARRAILWFVVLLIPFVLIAGSDAVVPRAARAQENGSEIPKPPPPGKDDKLAAGGPSADADSITGDEKTDDPGADDEKTEEEKEKKPEREVAKEINILELLAKGGWLMLPILAMSLLVVTFGIERGLALRRRKVLPLELIGGLGRLAGQKGGLDPRRAYKLCQQFPSAAASVIKTMLLKVGRPHTELEHAVSEANDREAARLYANVRWLSLGAGVTPLLGLLGTVWGMIRAFIATAEMTPGQNKAEELAKGIYQALVTTFAGLAVAIPAAVLAHWFEGRIQKLFRELDETLLGMLPQLERFEGRLRVSRDQMDLPASDSAAARSAAADVGPPQPEPPPDGQGHQEPAAAPKTG